MAQTRHTSTVKQERLHVLTAPSYTQAAHSTCILVMTKDSSKPSLAVVPSLTTHHSQAVVDVVVLQPHVSCFEGHTIHTASQLLAADQILHTQLP